MKMTLELIQATDVTDPEAREHALVDFLSAISFSGGDDGDEGNDSDEDEQGNENDEGDEQPTPVRHIDLNGLLREIEDPPFPTGAPQGKSQPPGPRHAFTRFNTDGASTCGSRALNTTPRSHGNSSEQEPK